MKRKKRKFLIHTAEIPMLAAEEPKELLEINCDTLRELSYLDKLKVLKVRADWLYRQRLTDRVMLRRQEVRAQKVAFLSKGICPHCRKHPVNKGHRICLMCAIRKSARTRQLRVLSHIFGRCVRCGHLIIPKKAKCSVKIGLRCECKDK
jgi:hypothetical protein